MKTIHLCSYQTIFKVSLLKSEFPIQFGIILVMYPAIFLDRDGVIIENIDSYVRSWDDVILFPQALEGLANLNQTSYKVIIVTNQSAVGRGLVTLEAVEEINQKLVRRIVAAGGRVDGIFICPHTPEDNCTCRKPKPGLILQAARELSIDLQKSILIGDALSDLTAGWSAGIPRNILVLTGRGSEQFTNAEWGKLYPFPVYMDLKSALMIELGGHKMVDINK
jgi:D-glycero-D-manno-heptose 1,7-bisphosphate phosphatase